MSSKSVPIRRLTPAQNRLIIEIQLLFFLFGLLLMIAGGLRIGIEFVEQIFGTNTEKFKEGIADLVTGKTFTSVPVLLVAIAVFLVGYGLWWSMAALGAKEPPAWHAGRNSLVVLLAVQVGTIFITLWLRSQLLVYVAPLIALIAGFTLWLLVRFSQPDLRLILGAERIARTSPRFAWWFYAIVVFATSTLTVLGLVYAVLTDRIELPLPDVQPGELLYTTTFDSYNDEWDLYNSSKETAQVVVDETGNRRLVLTMVFDKPIWDGIFSLLDRKFRDFDIRLATHQLQSDPNHDNRLGIIFRYRDNKHYYAFEISGDGYYRVVKVEPSDDPNQDAVTEISAWNRTTIPRADQFEPPFPTLVRPGSGNPITTIRDAMNEIRIIARGDKFWFFVNGQPMMLCLKGSTLNSTWSTPTTCAQGNIASYMFQDDDYKQGKIGVLIGHSPNSEFDYPVSIAFDNIVVLGPPSQIAIPNIETSSNSTP
jgi:hypothetical protein